MDHLVAHSPNPDGRWQLLGEHLREVARRAERSAAKFGAGEIGRWCGLWHDVGKVAPDVQRYLRGETDWARGPDHSSAGALIAAERFQPAAFIVAGHHGGLPSRTELRDRLARVVGDAGIRAAQKAGQALVGVPPDSFDLPGFIAAASRDERALRTELFLRMLFSALVDADFLDTEAHFSPQRAREREGAITLQVLWDRLVESREVLRARSATAEPPARALNRLRNEVYDAAVRAAASEPGVFSLSAPTGSGKTRTGLAFALRHALTHGLDRVIFAIPYTSIIDQTADEYRRIFREDGAVLEHHSALPVEDGSGTPSPEEVWRRLASENWDAPVVVTTTVQLFESLFSNRSSHCRKLHNIARSVIILDEVQTLPPHLLAPTLDVLRQLVDCYGCSVVLSTATQPALTESAELRGFASITEIAPNPEELFRALRRVHYDIQSESGKWSWARVAKELGTSEQAMVVLNTKRDALAHLDVLPEGEALHLSTNLCGAHRREVLQEVRRRLAAGEPCRLVTTQVVEAGVDLDFPLVLRAVGPLDRIVQAAGRCNREGRIPEGGRVVVFDPEEGTMPPGAYRKATDAGRALLRLGVDLHDPEVYRTYFQRYYETVNTDEARVQPARCQFDFPEVALRYRMIDEDTLPVLVPYRHAESVLKDIIEAQEVGRASWRRLQPYTVSVRRSEVERATAAGLCEETALGVWRWRGEYDPVRGLVMPS